MSSSLPCVGPQLVIAGRARFGGSMDGSLFALEDTFVYLLTVASLRGQTV